MTSTALRVQNQLAAFAFFYSQLAQVFIGHVEDLRLCKILYYLLSLTQNLKMDETVDLECHFLTVQRNVQRVGNAYLISKKNIFSTHIERSESEEKLFGDEVVVDINYLKSLDPKEWKDQDHYAVLGLGKLRYLRLIIFRSKKFGVIKIFIKI